MIGVRVVLAPCVCRTAFLKSADCPDLASCSLHETLLRARDAPAAVLEGYTLADAATGDGGEVFQA